MRRRRSGCMFAGITVATWYPITPSSSLCETLADYMREYRIEADGKATFAIVQAEDELAAIGMAIGAGWAGARSMTSTAGPGISLMNEFIGLAYYAEIPVVIFDITRVGPSTGLPTRTQQSDILSIVYCSHGDTKHIMLLPGSSSECFDMAVDAFDLTERFQTPIFVMSDLDLGMNNWMSDPFKYPDEEIRPRQGAHRRRAGEAWQVSSATATSMATASVIARFPAPIIRRPHTSRAAADTTRRRSTANGRTTTRTTWTAWRRSTKRPATHVPQPEIEYAKDAKIGFLAFGTTHWAIIESLDQLQKEYKHAGQLLPPARRSLHASILSNSSRSTIAFTSSNRTATRQMASLIKLELSPELGSEDSQHPCTTAGCRSMRDSSPTQ